MIFLTFPNTGAVRKELCGFRPSTDRMEMVTWLSLMISLHKLLVSIVPLYLTKSNKDPLYSFYYEKNLPSHKTAAFRVEFGLITSQLDKPQGAMVF